MQKEGFVPRSVLSRQCQGAAAGIGIKSIKYIGEEDVYNMEVKRHHNFSVCGGVIVHNCLDGSRYLCMGMWHRIKYMLPSGERGDEN